MNTKTIITARKIMPHNVLKTVNWGMGAMVGIKNVATDSGMVLMFETMAFKPVIPSIVVSGITIFA